MSHQRTSLQQRRRRAAPALALFLTLGTLTLLWSALSGTGSATTADPNAFTAADVAAGQVLFIKGCASCHGAAGEGGSQGPSVIGVGAAAFDFQVGTGRMPLVKPGPQAPQHDQSYSNVEIRQLDAYGASLSNSGPGIPVVDTATADIGKGGDLFRANCAQCHNFAGQGGALSSGKVAPAVYNATDQQVVEAMRSGPESMPVFAATQLSNQQANDIVRYIQFLRSPHDPGGAGIGHLGPVPEGLVIWIVGLVGVLGFCLWIGARDYPRR